jgi:hypothetical protein
MISFLVLSFVLSFAAGLERFRTSRKRWQIISRIL